MTESDTRPLTFACGDLTLEGALHLLVRQAGMPAATPAPGVVVCHPHPQYGGDMENNVVLAACQALAERGCAALRFNCRGVGASEGAFDPGAGAQDDARAALAHLSSLPEVDSNRLGLIGYSFGAMLAAEVASGALRALALVSPPISVADLRVAWGCPALVLAGDRDDFATADRLRVVADAPGVELHLVAGADHFWAGYEGDLSKMLVEFFDRHFQ